MTKRVTKRSVKTMQERLEYNENVEIVKRALAQHIIDHGPVTISADDWEHLATMKLAIKQENDQIKITLVI